MGVDVEGSATDVALQKRSPKAAPNARQKAIKLKRGLQFPLNRFPFSTQFANDGTDASLIDCAHRICRQAEAHKAVFFSEPESLFDEIGFKAALLDAGDFKSDSLFLLGNPADGVRISFDRHAACNLTALRHNCLLLKSNMLSPGILLNKNI